jgi:phosphatidylinositol transfer protein SFH5
MTTELLTSPSKPSPHTTLIILQKFLRANVDDLEKAKEQLLAALKWRKSYKPAAALNETFSTEKFGGLGYVTTVKGAKETKNEQDVVAFNVYGAAAKNVKETFGDTDEFVRWRVALMELTLQQLHLNEATKPIPDYGKGPDPYQAINVHDYLSVSFFRQPAEIKASSSKIIEMFQRFYPETVSYKYFVNVPLVMQWMMGAMKALMSKDSIQKMTWMTYGNTLNQYLGDDVPKEYGGSGAPLAETALTVKYGEADRTEKKEAPIVGNVEDPSGRKEMANDVAGGDKA